MFCDTEKAFENPNMSFRLHTKVPQIIFFPNVISVPSGNKFSAREDTLA